MPHPKPMEGQTTLSVERFEKALLWKIDELKKAPTFRFNRSTMLQYVLWQGLSHMGETKAGVRAEYAEFLRRAVADSVEA